MPRGTIKWFDKDKDYGFVLQEGGGPDLFVHGSEIDTDGTGIDDGRHVQFEIGPGPRGPRAIRVTLL